MAVQQNKKSPSRRNMRRAHDELALSALSTEPQTGSRHRRHHISENGYYRGRRIIEPVEAVEEEAGEE
jgi:large subunit ribosomal protein L32